MNRLFQVRNLIQCTRPSRTFAFPAISYGHLQKLSCIESKQPFSCSTSKHNGKRPLKVMNFPFAQVPGPIIRMRTSFMEFLYKRKFDKTFDRSGFLEAAVHVIKQVSEMISEGNFDELSEYMDSEAVDEIRFNYELMDKQHRDEIVLNEDKWDIATFLHSINFMAGSDGSFLVNCLVVVNRCPTIDPEKGAEHYLKPESAMSFFEKVLFVNALFSREFKGDTEGDWNLKKINYFKPSEVMGISKHLKSKD